VSVRGDAYHVADVATPEGSYTGTTGRFVPQAALTWSWPMMRAHDGWSEVIEPIVQGVVAPRGQNPEDIPNEDSLDFEFDDTNLFSTNRFTGWDRVEGGARVNYGLRYGAFIPGTGRLEMMGGQSWMPAPEGLFTEGSGLSEDFSDYVGRIGLDAGANLGFLYRFRLDKDTLQANRYELMARVGPPALRLTTSYIGIHGETLRASGQPVDREELSVGLYSRLSRYWRGYATGRVDLSNEVEPLNIGGGLGYEDECLSVDLAMERRYTYDEELESGLYVGLRVLFKTLGEAAIAN
jgi:LPS-assembly protein